MSEHAITPEGLAELRAELDRLRGEERRAIAERIRLARDWGDLKENAEYHDAKNDQALLERRITVLEDRLHRAQVVEPQDAHTVEVGDEVEAVDEASGRSLTYRLVGSSEADAGAGRLSVASPVGQALLGRRVGDTVDVRAPRGARRLRVARIN